MYAAITCSPPIGQSTIVSKDQASVHIAPTSTLSLNTEHSPDTIFCLIRDLRCIVRYISLAPVSLQTCTKLYYLVKEQNIRVSIWHNYKGQHEWSELPLQVSSELDDVVSR
jgi:hypothetical protein